MDILFHGHFLQYLLCFFVILHQMEELSARDAVAARLRALAFYRDGVVPFQHDILNAKYSTGIDERDLDLLVFWNQVFSHPVDRIIVFLDVWAYILFEIDT